MTFLSQCKERLLLKRAFSAKGTLRSLNFLAEEQEACHGLAVLDESVRDSQARSWSPCTTNSICIATSTIGAFKPLKYVSGSFSCTVLYWLWPPTYIVSWSNLEDELLRELDERPQARDLIFGHAKDDTLITSGQGKTQHEWYTELAYSWYSRRQRTTASSTMEAEYIAASEARTNADSAES